MALYRLDPLDEAIIAELQQDGRVPLSAIAASVHLSADAVRMRIARLTNDAILKVIGVVDPTSLGYFAQATVLTEFHGELKAITSRLQEYAEVTFLAVILGDKNVMFEVTARDDSALVDFVSEVVGKMPGLHSVEIWKFLAVYKWAPGTRPQYGSLPKDAQKERPTLDDLDVDILRILTLNPRATFAELEAAVGASYAVVRRRCRMLFDTGVVRTEVVVNRVSTQTLTMATLAIVVVGDIESVMTDLAAIPEVEILIRMSGRYAIVAEVACGSVDHLLEVADGRVRAIAGVHTLDVYPYVRIEKLPFSWMFSR